MVLASRKATVAAAALLALVVLGAMFLWLRDSSLVGVRQVDITGVSGSQADDIRGALTDAARDMTTLHVREDALRDAVQSYPVVRELHADADFPHRLRITVNSYDPIGSMELGGRSVAIARDGTVLDGTPTKGLTAIAATGSAAGTKITGTEATKLVRLLAAAPAPLRSRALRAYKGPNGLAVDLRDGPRLDFGDLDAARREVARGGGRPRRRGLARRLLCRRAAARATGRRTAAGNEGRRPGRTIDLTLSLMALARHSSCTS